MDRRTKILVVVGVGAIVAFALSDFLRFRSDQAAQERAAQDLGFANVDEMNRARQGGFTEGESWAAHLVVLAELEREAEILRQQEAEATRIISFAELVTCRANASVWREVCQSKQYELYGVVHRFSSRHGTRISLRETCDSSDTFSVDAENRKERSFFDEFEGRCLRFTGTIGRMGFSTPDIQIGQILWSEAHVDAATRRQQEEQRREEEAIQAQERQAAELEANRENGEWLHAMYQFDASAACVPAVERLARWSFEWTDRWLELKFDRYSMNVSAPYVLTVHGDKVRFQNGFGAWQRMSYSCNYNVVTGEALAYVR